MNISKLKRLISGKVVRVFDRPGLILVFGAGWIGGMTLRLPFFPWLLSDGASTVFGASVGALIGSACAALIAVNLATKDGFEARDEVAGIISSLRQIVAMTFFGLNSGSTRAQAALREISKLISEVDLTQSRLTLLKASDRHIKAAGITIVDALQVLDKQLRNLKREYVSLDNAAKNDRLYANPWPVPLQFKNEMHGFLDSLAKLEERCR